MRAKRKNQKSGKRQFALDSSLLEWSGKFESSAARAIFADPKAAGNKDYE